MRRRDFTVLLVGGTATWPLRVYAQQSRKIPRIGVLLPGGSASSSPRGDWTPGIGDEQLTAYGRSFPSKAATAGSQMHHATWNL